MRTATVERNTKETQISLTLNLDGTGVCSVENPIGFFGHMLNSFCKHGLFDLSGTLKGDLEVDQHHLIEDTGIALGFASQRLLETAQAFSVPARACTQWTNLCAAPPLTLAAVRFLCAMPSLLAFR